MPNKYSEEGELVWISPLNEKFTKPEVDKKCPWRQLLGTNTPSVHTKQDWKQMCPNGVFPDVLSMIGNTPLVKLNNIPKSAGLECNVYAKCEFLNPGGSIKDRMVKRMFDDAEKQGLIKPGMTIIELSSGNTGISIALIASLKGYKCVIVMPEKIAEEKEAVIRCLGAEVVRIPSTTSALEPDGLFGMTHRLHKEIPNSFIFDQFNHPSNSLTHYDTTANEVLDQLNNQVDMILFGAGTGGTITGVGRKFREVSPQTKLIGFDPEGSTYALPPSLNKTDVTFFEVEGIGYDLKPGGSLDQSVCDYWIKTNDLESLEMTRRLMKEEGLLVGMSSGAAVVAAVKAAKDLKKGQNVVIFLPDSIRNYMTKYVSDRWMEAKGYQPCKNQNNLWWWNEKVSDFKYRKPELVESTETLEAVLCRLDSLKLNQAVVMNSKGSMMGTITTDILRNKLMSARLEPTDLVERCTTRILPKLEKDSILGRAFRIIENDRFAIVVQTTGTGAYKIEKPIGVIFAEDLYTYTSKK